MFCAGEEWILAAPWLTCGSRFLQRGYVERIVVMIYHLLPLTCDHLLYMTNEVIT